MLLVAFEEKNLINFPRMKKKCIILYTFLIMNNGSTKMYS